MAIHSIREQVLDIAVDSEALALALQPHIGDVNRRRFVPVIERVLDEFAVDGEQISIPRLDIDLGDLPADNFEEAAEEALYVALRQAVDEALREAREGVEAGLRVRSQAAARLDLLDHYLLRGTLPFSERAEDFSPEALLAELAASDPAGLAATVRK